MSKVAREIDEGSAAVPRLESLVGVFTIASAASRARKCTAERGPKFDIRHEFIDTGGKYTFYAPGFAAATMLLR